MPPRQTDSAAHSNDTLFNGRLVCSQPETGYRFSVDAVLAAHFTLPAVGSRVLDLGCGCGVIGLIMAFRHPSLTVTSLEIQEELAALAENNGRDNGFGRRFRLLRGDLRRINELLAPECMDLVVCNPPYRNPASGRTSEDAQAARARHELTGALDDFVRAAAFAVRNRGRVVVVFPAVRLNTLLAVLAARRLTPKRLQPIYSYPGQDPARLVLVEAIKNGGEQIELMAPFYIYACKNGNYTPAMQALYEA